MANVVAMVFSNQFSPVIESILRLGIPKAPEEAARFTPVLQVSECHLQYSIVKQVTKANLDFMGSGVGSISSGKK